MSNPLVSKGVKPLAVSGFTLGTNGLQADGEPSFKDWSTAGAFLRYAEGAVQWWVGDWLNYGERQWGEMYAQAIDSTGFEYQTLRKAKYVAAKIELFRRRNKLSWSHHKEVADLEPDDQDSLLQQAEANDWSTRDLREKVKEFKGNDKDDLFLLTEELSKIKTWLLSRRESWPEHARPRFSALVENVVSQLEGDTVDSRGEGQDGPEAGISRSVAG